MHKEGKIRRNSLSRFYDPNYIYYIVTKTQDNYPYFKEEIFCKLFIEELRLAKKLKEFKLYAFSICYDHINLMIMPGEKFNISEIIQTIKKESSRDINYLIKSIRVNNVGDIPECRLQGEQFSKRNHKTYKVPILSKYLEALKEKIDKKEISILPFKWQKSYYDHVIRSDKDFEEHYNYTVYNPIKHGLKENWPYTSFEGYDDLIDYFEV